MSLLERYLRERLGPVYDALGAAYGPAGHPCAAPDAIEASFRVVEDAGCPPSEMRAIGPGPDGKPAILAKIVNIGEGGSDAEEA
jgi:hypothetical protein